MDQELAQKQSEKLTAEMPISADEFKTLITDLERQLDHRPCDHSLTMTETFLVNHPKKEAITLWLQQHGGYCDCEVLSNVVEDYLFVLEPKEDKPRENPINQMSSEKLQHLNTKAGLQTETTHESHQAPPTVYLKIKNRK
jgi:hypothetical protein